MARAYSLLSQAEWTPVSIADLLRVESEAFGVERFDTRGPSVPLKPQQALALGMVIHEVATNAVKYGALCNMDGQVAISWEKRDGDLHLHWQERNGPRVEAPERNGFGLVLVEGQVKSQLLGAVDVAFLPAGFVMDLSFPLGA